MALNHWLVLAVLTGILAALGCSQREEIPDEGEKSASAESDKQGARETGEKSASTPAKAVELQTSPWGELHNGLQCRVTVQKEIEHGMPLEANILKDFG